MNSFLKSLKDEQVLTDTDYLQECLRQGFILWNSLRTAQSSQVCSVPMSSNPCCLQLPSYKMAKFLVPILEPLTQNEHTVKNSATFCKTVLGMDSSCHLVSYDVESLFTSVPVRETIDIIIKRLFPKETDIHRGFNKKNFRRLLEWAVLDPLFVFNNELFMQIEGMAMGSPLGPTFANIFMAELETSFLEKCDKSIKPTSYNRYVDDTLTSFREPQHADAFLTHLNNAHPNIKFTMEKEKSKQINFLDILITRNESTMATTVFRKDCFTGQGLNYYSFCPDIFKLNSCKTLVCRAYKICSSYEAILPLSSNF